MLLRASSPSPSFCSPGAVRRPGIEPEPVRLLYLSAAVDGLTSCMLSQAQAHIADCSQPGEDLSATLSRFQGIAIGSAFMLGIPLGAELARRHSLRAPLLLSSALCAVNCALIATVLPSSHPDLPCHEGHEGGTGTNDSGNSSGSNSGTISAASGSSNGSVQDSSVSLGSFWLSANPVGAAVMLSRSGRLLVGSLTYLLVCAAQAVRTTRTYIMYVYMYVCISFIPD